MSRSVQPTCLLQPRGVLTAGLSFSDSLRFEDADLSVGGAVRPAGVRKTSHSPNFLRAMTDAALDDAQGGTPVLPLSLVSRTTIQSLRRTPVPSDESSTDGSGGDNLACAVCLQLPWEPVLWPCAEGAEQCGHVFCRGCVRQCVARAQPCCPLCRAPAAADAATRELPIDKTTEELVEQQAPAAYAARKGAALRETKLRSKLPMLALHSIGLERCDFRDGQIISIYLKEPAQLWLAVWLFATGERRLGVLFGSEADGSRGRLANVVSLPFSLPPMDYHRAVGRVLFEFQQKVRERSFA